MSRSEMLLAPASVSTHHSFSAEYDITKPIKLQGLVTKVEWMNPHTYFYINVKDERGRVTNWALEMGAPGALQKQGGPGTPCRLATTSPWRRRSPGRQQQANASAVSRVARSWAPPPATARPINASSAGRIEVSMRFLVTLVAVGVSLAPSRLPSLRPSRAAKPPAAPTPHWPDGRVNFGPEPGGKGHWNSGPGILSETPIKMAGGVSGRPEGYR